MKTIKQLIRLMVVCLLLSLLSVTAFAAEEIKELHLKVEEPVLGQKPSATVTVVDCPDLDIVSVKWNGKLDKNGCFQAGTVYSVTINTKVKDGLDKKFGIITNKKKVTVNGNGMPDVGHFDDSTDRKGMEVTYPFPFVFQPDGSKKPISLIRKVNVKVAEPALGQKPSVTATTNADNTYVKNISWTGELDSDGCFKPGVKYKVSLQLCIEDSADLAYVAVPFTSMFNINSHAAGKLTIPEDDPLRKTMVLEYTFKELVGSEAPRKEIAEIKTFGVQITKGTVNGLIGASLDDDMMGDYGEYAIQVVHDQSTPKPYTWFASTVTYKAKNGYQFTNNTKVPQPKLYSGAEVLSRNADTIVVRLWTYSDGSAAGKPSEDMKAYVKRYEGLETRMHPKALGKVYDPTNGNTKILYYDYPVSNGLNKGEFKFKTVEILDLNPRELIPDLEGDWYFIRGGNNAGFMPACMVEITEEVDAFAGAAGNDKDSPFAFAGGKGTPEDPYLIETAEQLNAMRKKPELYYKLIADIDLSDWGNWVPIGGTPAYGGKVGNINKAHYNALGFSGGFDGNGHVVSGMTIKVKEENFFMAEADNERHYGLFAMLIPEKLGGGYIKNLGVVNFNIDVEYTGVKNGYQLYAGALACRDWGMPIDNCYSAGGKINISINMGAKVDMLTNVTLGGLMAEASNVTMNKCYNTSDVRIYYTGEQDPWMRAAGIITTMDLSHINECWNSGSVTIEPYWKDQWWYDSFAAGITAEVNFPDIPGIYHLPPELSSSIFNCYNAGTIKAGNAVGVFNYSAWDVHLRNCYNVGKLIGNKETEVDGLPSTEQIINCASAVIPFGKEFVNDCYSNGNSVSGDLWKKSEKLGRKVLKCNPEDTVVPIPAKLKIVSSYMGKFKDVAANSWYATPVRWAVDKGITAGTSASTFGPEDTCTRAQIIMFLWRAVGCPTTTVANPFKDVKTTDYFHDAARWAYTKGMVTGTEFKGDTPCTRADTVTYLWKNVDKPATAVSNKFTDVPASADYAQAVSWALKNNVTAGTSDTTFSPGATCTRGQIMTFLYKVFK